MHNSCTSVPRSLQMATINFKYTTWLDSEAIWNAVLRMTSGQTCGPPAFCLLETTSELPDLWALVRGCRWGGTPLFSLSALFYGSCVFGCNQTQMRCGPGLQDVARLWGERNELAKGWESHRFLGLPTYGEHPTLPPSLNARSSDGFEEHLTSRTLAIKNKKM